MNPDDSSEDILTPKFDVGASDGKGTVELNWPDPWPPSGTTNEQWSAMLVSYIVGTVHVDESKVQYLKRALDIACMYSRPPGMKIREALCDLLDDALGKLENIGSSDLSVYILNARSQVEAARRFKGR